MSHLVPPRIKDLRKISMTLNFSKLFEKFLCGLILDDMKSSADKSQFGCKKKISIQHLLVKLIDRILTALDKNKPNEAYAVIVNLVDWSKAFDRQCPKLAIQSFIDNGVRKGLIPVLMSYFQDRKMFVKWKGKISSERSLPGGGPQGCPLGQTSYSSQSNNNADFVPIDDRFKWVDDLTMLEIINLITIGLASYNFKQHVASDIGVDEKFLSSDKTKSQSYTDQICTWTEGMKMKLNEEKSKIMIINFTKKYQFSTRMMMNDKLLDIVDETKVLGLIISKDLTWRKNTDSLVSRANTRLIIIRSLRKFPISNKDMVMLYCQFVRSILEFNCCVWFSSITEEEVEDLERVQRNAIQIILQQKVEDYQESLTKLNLETLKERRTKLAIKFGKKCLKIDEMKNLFKESKRPEYNLRHCEAYDVKFASRQRLFKSTVPTLQRLMNKSASKENLQDS